MKLYLYSLLVLLIIFSCKKETPNNFILKGKVKDLKKGVVYLQMDGDSTIVNLDSLVIDGQEEFTLSTNLENARLLYFKLFKNDTEEHYIPFFAAKGVTELSTSLQRFSYDAKIKGSKQQELLEEYLSVVKRFNAQNLNLIEANFKALKEKDSITADSINQLSQELVKRKYAFTIQFAMNNYDSEIAPYLAVYESPDANPIYLDSIYNKLTDSIKNSFYGKKLSEVISKNK